MLASSLSTSLQEGDDSTARTDQSKGGALQNLCDCDVAIDAGTPEDFLIRCMSFVSPQAVCLILERLVACGVLRAASHRPAAFVQAAGPPSFLRQPAPGTPMKVRVLLPRDICLLEMSQSCSWLLQVT